MKIGFGTFACVVLLGTGVVVSGVLAQASRVSYGRITAVRQVELQNQGAQGAGAMVGGLAGLATGSGQSSSNRALRTLGGAAVGGRVGGTNTIRIVTEKAGLRVRDCVNAAAARRRDGRTIRSRRTPDAVVV